jgi:hypothetical protein
MKPMNNRPRSMQYLGAQTAGGVNKSYLISGPPLPVQPKWLGPINQGMASIRSTNPHSGRHQWPPPAPSPQYRAG